MTRPAFTEGILLVLQKRTVPSILKTLTAGLATLGSGCLVAEPPDLQDPKQTRPFVYLLHVQPTVAEPIHIAVPDTGDPEPSTVNFSIPFQSEDLGEDVGVELHLYGQGAYLGNVTGTRVDGADLNTQREALLTWQPTRRPPGCYRLDAVIAHESSFNRTVTDGFVKEDRQSDSEAFSWLVNFYAKQEDTTMLNECPRVGL